jgi:hypothetical protein
MQRGQVDFASQSQSSSDSQCRLLVFFARGEVATVGKGGDGGVGGGGGVFPPAKAATTGELGCAELKCAGSVPAAAVAVQPRRRW